MKLNDVTDAIFEAAATAVKEAFDILLEGLVEGDGGENSRDHFRQAIRFCKEAYRIAINIAAEESC